MTRYALIDDGVVVNVILWDGDQPYDTTLLMRAVDDDSPVGVGWTLNGDQWIAPPVEPVEVNQAALDAEAARQSAKVAAMAKLMGLGLTEEEALALAGG